VLVRGRRVLVGRGVLVCGRSVLVGRGVLVEDVPAKAVAPLARAVCLVRVGESGTTAWVASREDVIGMNSACPTRVPERFATQQFISASAETRHQD
ncbi:MAG: hypothetical protein M3Y68_16230, partial [Chloroflexota bacterium]|nr:hypothetical protein [Chloroflexota bacterium]